MVENYGYRKRIGEKKNPYYIMEYYNIGIEITPKWFFNDM